MMILRSTPASPFGRKVKIAADILGLMDQITIKVADTNDPSDSVRKENPVGKIPVLVLEDGTSFYDSRVISEYLDVVAGGGRIIPQETKARFDALRLQALCDGILDACILLVYEVRYRPAEHRVATWVAYQEDKVARGLAVLEAAPPALTATPDVGQIALACVLGYLDLRFEGKWRAAHPKLVAWHDAFAAQVPMFGKTKVTA